MTRHRILCLGNNMFFVTLLNFLGHRAWIPRSLCINFLSSLFDCCLVLFLFKSFFFFFAILVCSLTSPSVKKDTAEPKKNTNIMCVFCLSLEQWVWAQDILPGSCSYWSQLQKLPSVLRCSIGQKSLQSKYNLGLICTRKENPYLKSPSKHGLYFKHTDSPISSVRLLMCLKLSHA